MKRSIVIVALLMSANVKAQDSLAFERSPKNSVGVDLVCPFIYATGNMPEQTRLSITYKRKINDRLRWATTGAIRFFKKQDSNSIMRIEDNYVQYTGVHRNSNPELKLSSGIEFTKQKGRFTRYMALDLTLSRSSYKDIEYQFQHPLDSGSIISYEIESFEEYAHEKTKRIAVGISAAYGYDFRISKHWSVNAETRFDINHEFVTSEYKWYNTTNKGKASMTNAYFRGIISRFGLNYIFG